MTKTSNKFYTLLREFEDAAIELSWKGSRHPEDWEDIEHNYTVARKKLRNWVLARITEERK